MNDKPDFDIQKQITHWQKGALEAWSDADYLIKGKRILLGLFAVHLALEKVLKAHIWRVKKKMPPYIHNLVRLAEIAELTLDDKHRKVLAEINEFQLEGRYSDVVSTIPSMEETKGYLRRAKGTFEWLINQL